MTADPDEDALSWGGETDPTHVETPARAKGASREVPVRPNGAERPAQPGPAILVAYGILAGVYLLYAVGWGAFAFVSRVPVQGMFFSIMYQVGEALAIASPFLWAAVVWVRVRATPWRILWLLVGVVVLPPWPMLFGGLG